MWRRAWNVVSDLSAALSVFGWIAGGISALLIAVGGFLQEMSTVFVVVLALATFVLMLLAITLLQKISRWHRKGFEITEIQCVIDNRNADRHEIQLCRLCISNVAGKPLRKCAVRMTSMLDKDGKESREVGRHLWLSRQRGNINPQEPQPSQSKAFDLSVGDQEHIDVVYLDPNKPTHIRVCYAKDELDKRVFINYGGLVSKCPYELKILVTSDDCRPETFSFQYGIDQSGQLFLTESGSSAIR